MPKFGFNPSEIVPEEPRSFEVLPKGEYTLRATDAEDLPTSTGGEMIKVTFEVTNSKLMERLLKIILFGDLNFLYISFHKKFVEENAIFRC